LRNRQADLPASTREIEEAHDAFSGAIKKMGEEFSWLIEAISTLAKAAIVSRAPT